MRFFLICVLMLFGICAFSQTVDSLDSSQKTIIDLTKDRITLEYPNPLKQGKRFYVKNSLTGELLNYAIYTMDAIEVKDEYLKRGVYYVDVIGVAFFRIVVE